MARMAHMGKYRARTWLRGVLPSVLAYWIPKGKRDCGCHEWYRRDDDWADCYHCEVGQRRLAPGEHLGPPAPCDDPGPVTDSSRRRGAPVPLGR